MLACLLNGRRVQHARLYGYVLYEEKFLAPVGLLTEALVEEQQAPHAWPLRKARSMALLRMGRLQWLRPQEKG